MLFKLKCLFLFRLILNRCKKKPFLSFKTSFPLIAHLHVKKRSVAKSTRRKVSIVRSAQRSNLQFLVSLVFSFFISSVSAQSIELSAGANRLDYQIGVAYGHRWNHFHLIPKLEFGVTSTVAQRRVFPRMSIASSYLFVKKESLDFGPEVVYALSRQKLTNQGKTAHYWNELYAGYRLQVGRKLKFVHSANGGWINESFFSELLKKRVNYSSLGIYVQIGVSYTF